MMKSWTDQPDIVEKCSKIGDFSITARKNDSKIVEIRTDPTYQIYYVTIGNLFGSETIFCPNAESVVRLLCGINTNSLPEDCKIEK